MFGRLKNWFDSRFAAWRPSEYTALLFMAVCAGILAGLANAAFRGLIALFHLIVFEKGGAFLGIPDGGFALALVPLLPMAGALFLFPLGCFFPGEVRG